jgi:6,7-dimethyl-8-ribityllumazine synthase
MSDVRVLEGNLDANGGRYCILVSRFNAFVTERLLEGAIDQRSLHRSIRAARAERGLRKDP